MYLEDCDWRLVCAYFTDLRYFGPDVLTLAIRRAREREVLEPDGKRYRSTGVRRISRWSEIYRLKLGELEPGWYVLRDERIMGVQRDVFKLLPQGARGLCAIYPQPDGWDEGDFLWRGKWAEGVGRGY